MHGNASLTGSPNLHSKTSNPSDLQMEMGNATWERHRQEPE